MKLSIVFQNKICFFIMIFTDLSFCGLFRAYFLRGRNVSLTVCENDIDFLSDSSSDGKDCSGTLVLNCHK